MRLPEGVEVDEVLYWGKSVVLEPGVMIRARRLWLGDNVYIGADTRIIVPEIYIGDYTKIHNHSLVHGYRECYIGHNCWFGQGTIIDSIGGCYIGNNVGAGAYSQLWSHIRFGDTLEGCRFNSARPLIVEDDVWFVGHCIVSPIHAKAKSMALVGSVVTRDMEENRVYAGVPARDITDKIGPQFAPVPVEEKERRLVELKREFFSGRPDLDPDKIQVVREYPMDMDPRITYINVSERTYTKRLTQEEVAFLSWLYPVRGKFLPKGAERFWELRGGEVIRIVR